MKGETTMVVTDQEIANGVENLLRQSPANSVNSLNVVVQLLGARFGQDLSHKTSFIQEILRYHNQQLPPSPIPLYKDHFTLQHQQHPHFLNINHQFPSNFPINHLPAVFRGASFSPPSLSPTIQAAPQLHYPPPPQPPPPPQTKNAGKGNKESGQAGTKKRGAGGLNKVCGVSPELQVVVGESALPRTEILRQLWAYIRKNNLQDPSNKRKIICDDALRAVFEIDCTDMFKMNKLLSKHIHSLDPSKIDSASSKRLKTDSESSSENPESVDSSITISEPLAMFLGTGKKEMLQSEAIQYVLEYIKVNQLEDPNAMVTCDLKLRELFGCESMNISDVPNMLARHHLYKT